MSGAVFVAVPAYSGEIVAEAVVSLLRAGDEARALGRECLIRLRPRDSLIVRARNVLARQFLDSGADDLVFWDADVACGPGAFARLLSHPVDCVAGAYPFRCGAEAYPVRPLAQGWRGEGDLVEVEGAPAGFLRVTRSALERLIAARPEAWFEDREVGRAPLFFEMEVADHKFASEDFVFCRRLAAIGVKTFVDAAIPLVHVGLKPYVGDFGRWLGRRLAAAATPESLAAAKAELDAFYAAALAAGAAQ